MEGELVLRRCGVKRCLASVVPGAFVEVPVVVAGGPGVARVEVCEAHLAAFAWSAPVPA